MSLLSVMQALSKQVGLDVPQTVSATQERDLITLISLSVEAADECVRRTDFGALKKQAKLVVSNGGIATPPPDFLRFTSGTSVYYNMQPVRGSLSDDEWLSLSPVNGAPRIFRKLGNTIQIWPAPNAGEIILIGYITGNWCSNGTASWAADAETAIIPEALIIKGTLWRWRRHMGLDFADHMAEFEASLTDYAAQDNRMRTS